MEISIEIFYLFVNFSTLLKTIYIKFKLTWKLFCHCQLYVISNRPGEVGTSQMMMDSGSAPAYLLWIYLVMCLSNLPQISLFHLAPSILETSSSIFYSFCFYAVSTLFYVLHILALPFQVHLYPSFF